LFFFQLVHLSHLKVKTLQFTTDNNQQSESLRVKMASHTDFRVTFRPVVKDHLTQSAGFSDRVVGSVVCIVAPHLRLGYIKKTYGGSSLINSLMQE